MVNRNSIQNRLDRLVDDIPNNDHHADEITENEVVNLFQDHGADSDVDDYLYSVSTPTLKTALDYLGY